MNRATAQTSLASPNKQQDCSGRIIKASVCTLRSELKAFGHIKPTHSPAYLRLSEEAQRRQTKFKLQTFHEAEEETEVKPKPLMSEDYAQQLFGRLYDESHRRAQELASKQKAQELQQTTQINAVLLARHPRRPMDRTVYNRLIEETKIIERCYGKPGRPALR